MVTEYIKRNHKKGYDAEGILVYKVRVDEDTPVIEDTVEEDDPVDTTPSSGGLFG